MKNLILILIFSSACTLKNFNYNTLIVSNASIACDYGQTVNGLKMGIPEQNPILGDHPSMTRLTAYNAAAIGANTLAYYVTGKIDERFKWMVPLVVLTMVQLPTLMNNALNTSKPVCGLY